MSFKISGNTVIDGDSNLNITGIATIGSGSSAISIGSTQVTVGTGITFDLINQNLEINGTLSGGITLQPSIQSFAIAAGTTDISREQLGAGLTFVFDYPMDVVSGATTTISMLYEDPSYPGIRTGFESVGIGSTFIEYSADGKCVTLKLSIDAYGEETKNNYIYPVIPDGFFCTFGFGCYPGLNAVGVAQTYRVGRRADLIPGQIFEGGYVICVDTGAACAWVIAPPTAQLGRNWFDRNDANTCAQTVTGYGGWFIATSSQWQNPGYSCRANWPYNPATYWTNHEIPTQSPDAYYINMSTGTLGSCWPLGDGYSGPGNNGKPVGRNVRSFRCVTY